MLLLIDNYDSFTCNIAALFNILGQEVFIKKNDAISIEEICKISPSFLVIGPGPGTPQKAGISLSAVHFFAGKIPILGICLGHQAIGEAFGLKVIKSKSPMHGKEEIIFHNNKGIFKEIENRFTAIRYNSLVIDGINPSSPLEITAKNKIGEIMGIRHKNFPIEGVQFHPESIFSTNGKKIFQNFLGSELASF